MLCLQELQFVWAGAATVCLQKLLCLKELQSCVCMGCNIAFAGTVMFCLQDQQCRCCSSCNVLFAGAALLCFTWRLYPFPIET